MENLLPGAQDQFSVLHRHGDLRSHQAGLQVGVPVAVVPGLLVPVFATRGYQPIQQFGQVLLQAGLELDRSHHRRAADVEHMDQSRAHPGLSHDLCHPSRDVVHVPVARGLDLDALAIGGHGP